MFKRFIQKRQHAIKITLLSFVLLAIGIFAYVTFFSSSAYANLLSNPGCDTNVSGWTGFQATLTRSTGVFRSGGASCQVTHQTGDAYTIDDAPSTVENPVPGESYTATAWVRGASATGKPVRMAIRQWTSTSDTKTWSSYVNLSTTWQQITVTSTVASSTVELDMYIVQESAVAGNSFYVDDIQLVKNTAPSVPNLVVNPGFESGLTSWQPNIRAGAATITTTTSTQNGGASSAQITVTAAAAEPYEIELAQYGRPLTAGKTYTIGFWARASTTRSIDTVIQRSTSPYTVFNRRTTPLSTSWQYYSYTFVAPAGIVDSFIGFQFGTATGTYWIDDVFIGEGSVVPTPAPTAPPGQGVLLKAINFNGAQLDVDGINFQAESTAGVSFPNGVTRFSNTSVTLNPSVSTNRASMLRSSVWRGSNIQFMTDITVPNGTYFVYVHTWEDTGSTTYNLGFENNIVASTINSGNAGAWKKLGPYTVTVNDGVLSMFQTGGDFNLSGLEIYQATAQTGTPTIYNTITYRSSSTNTNGAASTSLTLSRPTGTVQGDVMLAQVVVGGAGTTTITSPTGWTLIRRDNTNTTTASGLYSKVSGASEPASYTWNFNSSQPAAGGIATYYNVDTSSPIANHSGQFNDDNPTMTAPSTNAATPADKLLFFGSVAEGAATITAPSNTTARWTVNTNPRTAYLSERQLTTSGATGNYVATHSRGAIANLAQLVLLRPSVGVVPTAAPLPGSIINLNYFVSNFNPWVRAVCGDFRMDNGINNPVSAGQFMMTTNSSCTNSGVVFTGDSPASFGSGQASSSNQVVGGFSYPEVYLPPNSGSIFLSYENLSAKSKTTDTPPINLGTICNLSDCTLPANLAQGVYTATGNVVFNAYTFPGGRNYVFLIDGNITFRGNMITPVTSTAIFSASGNIIVPPTVGVAPAATTPSLSGIFSADDSFIMQSTNTCADLRLNIEGVLIVNAAQSGGSFQNDRDMCGNNITNPSLQITQRLDFVVNMPEFTRIQSVVSNEVAP